MNEQEEKAAVERLTDTLENIDDSLAELVKLLRRADDRASGKKHYRDSGERI